MPVTVFTLTFATDYCNKESGKSMRFGFDITWANVDATCEASIHWIPDGLPDVTIWSVTGPLAGGTTHVDYDVPLLDLIVNDATYLKFTGQTVAMSGIPALSFDYTITLV